HFADVVTGFQTASIDASVGHGTVVRLEKLRMPWGPDAVEALKRSLSRLLPPPPPAELSVPDQPEFAIYIDTPDGPLRHHHGFVAASETLAHPLYRLVGTVDADGNAHLAIYSSGSEPAVVVEENIRKDSDRPSCGPLK
ncbi:histidine kinase, partial [Streptomyces sp. NPDC059909]